MMKHMFKKTKSAYEAERLLDLEMPGGKPLRHFTADEAYRADGWLRSVSRLVSRGWVGKRGRDLDRTGRRTVGQIFSEYELGAQFMAFYIYALWRGDRDPVGPGDEIADSEID